MHQGQRLLTTFALIFMLLIIPGGSLELKDVRASSPDPGEESGPYNVTESNITYLDREGNTIKAKLFYPEQMDGAPYPAIVFGEDYNLSLDVTKIIQGFQYRWLAEKITSWGFVMLFPKYTENTPTTITLNDNYNLWVNQTYDSICYLLNETKKGSSHLYNRVDKERIALMGHGGGGAISIVEASFDKRVRCVVSLSPTDKYTFLTFTLYKPPYPTEHVKHLTPIPLQIQVGDEIEGDLPYPFNIGEINRKNVFAEPIYNIAKSPKELIIINQGNHYAFLDNYDFLNQKNISLHYSVSFLKYYLYNENDYYEFLTENVEGIVNSEVRQEGLEKIIQNIDVIYDGKNAPFEIDLKNGEGKIDVFANITPRGIGFGSSAVKVIILPPEGDSFENYLVYNDNYDQNAGYYFGTFSINPLFPLGKYNLFVLAINVKGESFSSEPKTFTIMSSAKKPVAKLEVSKQIAETGDKITFNASKSFDEDNVEILRYNFSFGDGNYSGWIPKEEEIHYYSRSGIYYAFVKVKNEYGAESEESEKVKIIIDILPIARIDSNLTEIYVNETVTFDANDSYDKDGKIVEYFFDFGDGENSSWTNQPYIIHRYKEEGEYFARLKVRDDVGAESEWSKNLSIIVIKKEIPGNGEVNNDASSSSSKLWIIIVLFAIIIIVVGGGFLLRYVGKEEVKDKKTEMPIKEEKREKEEISKTLMEEKVDKKELLKSELKSGEEEIEWDEEVKPKKSHPPKIPIVVGKKPKVIKSMPKQKSLPQYKPYSLQTPQIGKTGRKKAIVHSRAIFIPKDSNLQKSSQPFYQKPKYEKKIEREEKKGLVIPKYKKVARTYDDLVFPDIEIGVPKKLDDKKKEDKK